MFREQEEDNKRKYQQRVLDVEMGSFTPLVVWNQWRNGKRVSAVLKASCSQDSSEGYRALLCCNHFYYLPEAGNSNEEENRPALVRSVKGEIPPPTSPRPPERISHPRGTGANAPRDVLLVLF